MVPFIDLRDLIVGLTVVVSMAISLGKLDQLHDFAVKEFLKSMKPSPEYHFFPPGYEVKGPKRRDFLDVIPSHLFEHKALWYLQP